MTSLRRVALYNPVAGQRWFDRRVHRALAMLEREEHATVIETVPGGIVEQTRALLAAGATEIIACGGDGTVCDVATALADTPVPLRIVPCGTTNVLARDFGIPINPIRALHATAHDDASASWATARVRPLQTWTAGTRQLVLGVGLGWDAQLLHRLPRRWKRALGLGVMVPLGAWLAVRYQFPSLLVEGVDATGARRSAHGTSLLVCNIGHWGGRNHAFPDVDPGDDLLDVIVLERATFVHLASFWSLLMIPGGRPLRLPGVQRMQLRTLTITVVSSVGVEEHVNGDATGVLTSESPPLAIAPSGRVWVRVPERPAR